MRHRLSQFLLRQGRRPPTGVRLWTARYLTWVRQDVHLAQQGQEETLWDHVHEVEHQGDPHAGFQQHELEGQHHRKQREAPANAHGQHPSVSAARLVDGRRARRNHGS
ncbi:MAG: hypothetical protein IMZ55_15755, partial [Acidobacteria bacterium]|nr:hypothetical protein [Acidobacteriota bacterium]